MMISVSIFRCLEPGEFNNFKKPELYPEFSARQETTVILWKLLKDTVIMDMPTQAKQWVNTVLEH